MVLDVEKSGVALETEPYADTLYAGAAAIYNLRQSTARNFPGVLPNHRALG